MTASTQPTPAADPPKPRRRDLIALWAGVAFSLVFVAIIWLAGERLNSIPLLPDQGMAWYYWKLPAPTWITRATAWGFYLAHQLVIWGLIWYAQKHNLRYTTGLHKVNLWALAASAFFILLHFVQTHIWYDGLAQDVSIFSSQGSVIVLLVWILLMENSRRGMFGGKKLPIKQEIIRFARKYHGYFFAWATIYTFWYHPMVNTSGHLIGFLYMFLLMLQGSLFFTRIHVNRWWTVLMEVSVMIHGTLVAVMQGNGIWPMFLFGFAGIFVITQMHGLGLKAVAEVADPGGLHRQRDAGLQPARLGPAQRDRPHPGDRVPVRHRAGADLRRRPVGGEESAPAQGRGRETTGRRRGCLIR